MAFISPSSPQKSPVQLRFISVSSPPSSPLHLGSQSNPHIPRRDAPAFLGGMRALGTGPQRPAQPLFTARRKAAYEALHPETRQEKTRNGGLARQVGDPENRTPRFTADTASKTGQSERAVQRNAERGEKVTTAALAMVKGTRWGPGGAA